MTDRKEKSEVFEGKNEFENGVIGALRIGMASIGPEEILIEEHKPLLFNPKLTLYDFKDALKYNFEMFFLAKSMFDELVVRKIGKYKNYSNGNYGIALGDKVFKKVADRICERESNIKYNLNTYVVFEDVNFAIDYTSRVLEENFGEYTTTLLTDLVSLDGIDNIEIGNLRISKLQEAKIEIYKNLEPSGLFAFLEGEVLDKWDGLVEINNLQKGLHLEDEGSVVFEKSLAEFKTFFSYLLLCEYKLQNVREDKFPIGTEDLGYESPSSRKSRGIQKYYVTKSADSPKIMRLNTKYLDPHISNKKFILNEQALARISKYCALEEYKKLIKEKDGNGVAQKIIRAMDWFLQANLEDDMTDSAIKLFIALESLFATGGGLNTKTISENVAMACTHEINERLGYAKRFNDLLQWRNKIVHHGSRFEDEQDAWKSLKLLKTGVTWSIFCTILLFDKICILGKDGGSINKYFNNRKLGAHLL